MPSMQGWTRAHYATRPSKQETATRGEECLQNNESTEENLPPRQGKGKNLFSHSLRRGCQAVCNAHAITCSLFVSGERNLFRRRHQDRMLSVILKEPRCFLPLAFSCCQSHPEVQRDASIPMSAVPEPTLLGCRKNLALILSRSCQKKLFIHGIYSGFASFFHPSLQRTFLSTWDPRRPGCQQYICNESTSLCMPRAGHLLGSDFPAKFIAAPCI